MPTLHVLRGPDKGRTFEVANEASVVGRAAEHVKLSDNTVSREHAELVPENDHWMLVDKASSNGTYLNGTRISGATPIKHGDQIKIGATLMVFSGDDTVERYSGVGAARDMVDIAGREKHFDSSILSSISSPDDSVILAAPETADAVHAWNVMYRLAELLGGIETTDEFLEHVSDIIYDHLPVDRVFILMRSENGEGEFTPQVVRYRSKNRRAKKRIITSQTIINHVIEKREGILCANATADPRFASPEEHGSIHDMGLRSIICVPIIAGNKVEGVIHIDCPMYQHVYTHDQLRLVGSIGGMVGMAIQNVRLLEERMETARLAAMGEAVAFLAHHIRNIVQGLRSGSDVIELGLKKEKLSHIANGWKIIHRNLDRTMLLATNMLTFSKEREGRLELAQLNKVIEDVVSLAQGPADDRGVMLLADLDEIPAAPINVEGLHQVLLNLVINAIDACASSDEGDRVTIHSFYRESESLIGVSVIDDGPGIEPEILGTMFEAFRSSKGHGGTGLGLAAAKKVVDEMDGTITVESEPGKGTTFSVTIPASRPGSQDSSDTTGHQL